MHARSVSIQLPTAPDTVSALERTRAPYLEAVAYLATWAVRPGKARDVVTIVVSGDGEVSAYYEAEAPAASSGLLMVAVWHPVEARYSYHT